MKTQFDFEIHISLRKKDQVRVEMHYGDKERVVYGSVRNVGRLTGGVIHHWISSECKENTDNVLRQK